MKPQKECLYCEFRGGIKQNNRTSCSNPHPDVKATPIAELLGYFDYPKEFRFQSKNTQCPNFKERIYG